MGCDAFGDRRIDRSAMDGDVKVSLRQRDHNALADLSPLRHKMLEFECILEDCMTPRQLIAFGASASTRRNEEKSAGSRHRHKGGHHARQSPGRKSV